MQKSFLRETAGVIMRAVVVVLTIVMVIIFFSALYEVENKISDGTCNVAVLPIEGTIVPFYGIGDLEMITTPETVESFMKAAEEDENIEAVLVEINSPGGTPVAAERIAKRLRNSDLPVVGMIGDVGASGGYMVAAATDYLFASAMSDVGSIGVNMSYVEESEKNKEEGLTYVQLTSGKFKDIGSPNRPITDEEKELLLSDLKIVHDEFVNLVANFRSLDKKQVEELADGSSMPGRKALEKSLIDAIGGREEVRKYLAEKVLSKSDVNEIKFCEYKNPLLPF